MLSGYNQRKLKKIITWMTIQHRFICSNLMIAKMGPNRWRHYMGGEWAAFNKVVNETGINVYYCRVWEWQSIGRNAIWLGYTVKRNILFKRHHVNLHYKVWTCDLLLPAHCIITQHANHRLTSKQIRRPQTQHLGWRPHLPNSPNTQITASSNLHHRTGKWMSDKR